MSVFREYFRPLALAVWAGHPQGSVRRPGAQAAMRRPRALDLFCRAGGVSEGFLRAGFDVVGVDLGDHSKAYNRGPGNPDRHDRPARFVQADALLLLNEILSAQRGGLSILLDHIGGGPIDFIWASPPCQAHSALRKLHPGREYPDLIPATRERLVASGIPYAIENVPGAPLGGFLIQLCGTMFGLQTPDGRAELRRHRLFETSWPIALRPACQHGHEGIRESLTVTGTGMGPGNRGKEAAQRSRAVIPVTGHTPVDNRGRRQVEREREALRVCGVEGAVTSRSERPRVISVVGQKGLPGTSHARRALAVAGNGARAWNPTKTISVTGATPQRQEIHNTTRETFSTDDARHAMGIDWMAMKDLSQAIPPAYAEWIARRALEMLVP